MAKKVMRGPSILEVDGISRRVMRRESDERHGNIIQPNTPAPIMRIEAGGGFPGGTSMSDGRLEGYVMSSER